MDPDKSRTRIGDPGPQTDGQLKTPAAAMPGASRTWHGGRMTSESRHISEWIGRRADEVYDYTCDPANLPQWAPGLGSSVDKIDDRWFVETSAGRVGFAFVQRNEHGVLDHYVTLPSGEVVYNPMRVIPDGDSSEVVFTLR